MATKIEWTDEVWNPVTGCTKVSPGCDHCYAETFAERWRGTPGHHFEQGFDVKLWHDRLEIPLRWKRPRRIFVNSMSDVFHEKMPDGFIACMFAVMAATPQHTYQVLTKRQGRMRSLLRSPEFRLQASFAALSKGLDVESAPWPLPNVWLGVSAEDQQWADIRIPALLDTPAAVRFVSAEPLLGHINLPFVEEVDGCTCGAGPGGHYGAHERGCGTAPGPAWGNLHWVIVGGESGPGARSMNIAWARSLIRQCRDAGAPVFVKQLGSVTGRLYGAGSKGGNWDMWPAGLRVREFPRATEAVTR